MYLLFARESATFAVALTEIPSSCLTCFCEPCLGSASGAFRFRAILAGRDQNTDETVAGKRELLQCCSHRERDQQVVPPTLDEVSNLSWNTSLLLLKQRSDDPIEARDEPGLDISPILE